jgi:hypothetical protein
MVTPDTDGQRWSPPVEDVLDPVFGRMGIRPMIVVIPDGNSRYGCGQWVDSPVTGNFEQYVVNAVVAFVDAHHRTVPDSGVVHHSDRGSQYTSLAFGRTLRESGLVATMGAGAVTPPTMPRARASSPRPKTS